jgi:hypothetical protein
MHKNTQSDCPSPHEQSYPQTPLFVTTRHPLTRSPLIQTQSTSFTLILTNYSNDRKTGHNVWHTQSSQSHRITLTTITTYRIYKKNRSEVLTITWLRLSYKQTEITVLCIIPTLSTKNKNVTSRRTSLNETRSHNNITANKNDTISQLNTLIIVTHLYNQIIHKKNAANCPTHQEWDSHG